MTHITTLSFQLNTENLFCKTRSRSLLQSWQRKLPLDTTLNSSVSDMIKTTYTYFATSLRNTADRLLYESSKALLHVSYSSNFLCSRKTSGEESSGVMVSTLPQCQSGEIGSRSKGMSPTKERQAMYHINYDYLLRQCLVSYPVGLPRGN